ncbi:DUF411 domain-containing protein [Chromobacterium sp. S0633]|uniref:DUF411 domain-containing protein n=1 Tax=Chromobacterium sp. S0633 TaxID=2957805 RepID=UPI00209F9669|nr:DUF411 domain-containing protein [Chromobacterium sp. S0633]MCP1289236.1 DUF411 domain-containing protein [Chromobacterium sp. S0633]
MNKRMYWAAAALAVSLMSPVVAAAGGVMHKDPYCGCCSAWAEHMQQNGVALQIRNEADMSALKARLKVPADLRSCHTAEIGGYVFEGHVPADLVKKVLKDKPKIVGLAVPGMPMGSPGMEGPSKQAYQVLSFDGQGRRSVYATR